MKEILVEHGLPTPSYEIIEGENPNICLPYPVVLKAPLQVYLTMQPLRK